MVSILSAVLSKLAQHPVALKHKNNARVAAIYILDFKEFPACLIIIIIWLLHNLVEANFDLFR